MNKQRYLAELQRLLVFMTEADRTETVSHYGVLFDAAGPDGEAALLERIGSPTKAAIGLSRGYEPGKLSLPEPVTPPEAEPAPEPAPQEEDPWQSLPSFDLPDYIEELLPDEEEPEPDEVEKPFSMPDLPGHAPARPHSAQEIPVKRGIPLGLGIPLFILALPVLYVPLAAVCIAVMLALLVPGAAIIFGAYLLAVGGLWCIGFMADTVLMFGAAFIVLAFGLILLFGGFWVGVKLAGLYLRGARALTRALLGERRPAYE